MKKINMQTLNKIKDKFRLILILIMTNAVYSILMNIFCIIIWMVLFKYFTDYHYYVKDNVTSDTVTNDTVTNDTVTNDTVTNDTVTNDKMSIYKYKKIYDNFIYMIPTYKNYGESLPLTFNTVENDFLPYSTSLEESQILSHDDMIILLRKQLLEKELLEKQLLEKQLLEKELLEKQLLEKELLEKQLLEKELLEKQLLEKELLEKELLEKQLLEKQLSPLVLLKEDDIIASLKKPQYIDFNVIKLKKHVTWAPDVKDFTEPQPHKNFMDEYREFTSTLTSYDPEKHLEDLTNIVLNKFAEYNVSDNDIDTIKRVTLTTLQHDPQGFYWKTYLEADIKNDNHPANKMVAACREICINCSQSPEPENRAMATVMAHIGTCIILINVANALGQNPHQFLNQNFYDETFNTFFR
jgi:hypothetical protein